MFKLSHRPAHIVFAGTYHPENFYIRHDLEKEAHPPLLLKSCKLISLLVAKVHDGLISIGYLRPPTSVRWGNAGRLQVLRTIWYAKMVKKAVAVLIRTPLRDRVLSLFSGPLPFPQNSGCVITSCHTPWRKLLVRWCLENDFLLIAANGQWAGEEKRIQLGAHGFSSLRQIVTHLRQKGKVFIAMDTFNDRNNCLVSFLGDDFNAPTLPARLAKIANVPLQMILPVLGSNSIDIVRGPRFDPRHANAEPAAVMGELVNFLDSEIRNDPSIWEPFVK